jgi:hypothetical protein
MNLQVASKLVLAAVIALCSIIAPSTIETLVFLFSSAGIVCIAVAQSFFE